MPIIVTCTCGKKLTIDEKYRGKKTKCPACGSVLIADDEETAIQSETPRPKKSQEAAAPRAERKADVESKSKLPWIIAGGCGVVAIFACMISATIGGWVYYSRSQEEQKRAEQAAKDEKEWKIAADKRESANNLKNIALAHHNFHDVYKHLSAGIGDGQGKPLLSWRVALLPFIDQQPLYMQFDLDKPWDHPTNMKLVGKMPKTYMVPGVEAKEGMTHYRSLVGPGPMFNTMLNPVAMRGKFWAPRYNLATVPDGTSNTIMVVEAAEPMIWTKPDDLRYDAKAPLPKFGVRAEGFHVAVGDGSVRFLPSTISDATLRNAITADDGFPLGADW